MPQGHSRRKQGDHASQLTTVSKNEAEGKEKQTMTGRHLSTRLHSKKRHGAHKEKKKNRAQTSLRRIRTSQNERGRKFQNASAGSFQSTDEDLDPIADLKVVASLGGVE